jgi:hypothetical protein
MGRPQVPHRACHLATICSTMASRYGESALAAISVAKRHLLPTSGLPGLRAGPPARRGLCVGSGALRSALGKSYRFSAFAAIIGISRAHLLSSAGQTVTAPVHGGRYGDGGRRRISLRIQCPPCLPSWGIVVNMLCAGLGRAGRRRLGLSRQGICFLPLLPLAVWLFGSGGSPPCRARRIFSRLPLALAIAANVRRDHPPLMAEDPALCPNRRGRRREKSC